MTVLGEQKQINLLKKYSNSSRKTPRLMAALVTCAILLFAPMLLSGPAQASDSDGKAVPIHLTQVQRDDLAYIENYLNALHTLRADVTQYGPDGSVRMAKLAISRPGRMRLIYAPPVESLMIADGTFLNFWDAEMHKSSSTPIGSTLAAFLLRDRLSFTGDVTVTGYKHGDGVTEVTLTKTDVPEEGDFTLVFEDKPFGLRQWRVRDAEDNITRVSLENVETGIPLDDSLFHYVDPRFGASKGAP